jgi:hypothetical protein
MGDWMAHFGMLSLCSGGVGREMEFFAFLQHIWHQNHLPTARPRKAANGPSTMLAAR